MIKRLSVKWVASLDGEVVLLRGTANHRNTLAAAYAEAGRFRDAVSAQARAVAMARAERWRSAKSIAGYEHRLRLYRQGQPYRD